MSIGVSSCSELELYATVEIRTAASSTIAPILASLIPESS